MAEMAVRIIIGAGIIGRVVYVIKLFDHWVVRRGRRQEIVYLRRIREKRGPGWTRDPGDVHGRGSQEKIVAIPVCRAGRFELELRHQIIERRANLNAPASQVWIESANCGVELPLPFRSLAQPAKPKELPAVG